MDFVAEIQFDELTYRELISELKLKTGVVLEGYRIGVAYRRISRRIRKTDCKSLAEYLDYLHKNPGEAEELARLVTLPVGRFFRNQEVFEMLEEEILPVIFNEARPDEKLLAWSAGCGEGEEAYSLAIILKKSFTTGMKRHPFSVIGTDVNSAALQKAKSACYEESRLIEMPDALKRRFLKQKEGCWEVPGIIRELVKFRRESLPDGKGVLPSNLITMRNLLIYYNRELQDRLLRKVHSCLKPGGTLVLGKSETLPAKFREYFGTISSHNRIYRKAS